MSLPLMKDRNFLNLIVKKGYELHFKRITDSYETVQKNIAEITNHFIIDALFYGNINNKTVERVYHNLFKPHLLDSTMIQSQLNVTNSDEVIRFLNHHYNISGSFVFRQSNLNFDFDKIVNYHQLGSYSIANYLLEALIEASWGNQFEYTFETKMQVGFFAESQLEKKR